MTHAESPEPRDVIVQHRWPDGQLVEYNSIVAIGQANILLRHRDLPHLVLKAPRYYSKQQEDGSWVTADDQDSLYRLWKDDRELEVAAYTRLANVEGIVGYHGLVDGCIATEYHPLGSVDRRMLATRDCPPTIQLRLKWMSDAVHIIAACHKARVLLFDVALRNFVIAHDNSLRAIDFAAAEVLPIDEDIDIADVRGLTARVDLFYLGCVLYSLATWSDFEMVSVLEYSWPAAETLPCLEGVPWGPLIRYCWQKRFVRAEQLLEYCGSRQVRKQFKLRAKDETEMVQALKSFEV